MSDCSVFVWFWVLSYWWLVNVFLKDIVCDVCGSCGDISGPETQNQAYDAPNSDLDSSTVTSSPPGETRKVARCPEFVSLLSGNNGDGRRTFAKLTPRRSAAKYLKSRTDASKT